MLLPVLDKSALLNRKQQSIPADIFAAASKIVQSVKDGGRSAVEHYAQQFDQWQNGKPLVYSKTQCADALTSIPDQTRQLLETVAARIRDFATRQRDGLQNFSMPSVVDGMTIGIDYKPVQNVGCYAPGGRYPLISSALMTIIPARVAGAQQITLATPNPAPVMLAAAAIAGADQVLAIGGAQAIAALAYGADILSPCDMIVGPGNQWVAAAKQIIATERGIDFLAGPSELMIIADDTANPAWIAADLLAQAEHDTAAIPVLITPSNELANQLQSELQTQLAALPEPNQSTARAALAGGAIVMTQNLDEAVDLANITAPEHLQLITENADKLAQQCDQYGSIFIGARAAEVFGDYGIGPNHTLPTGGAARFSSGLSVMNFLKPRTYIRASNEIDQVAYTNLIAETAALARLEGLEAHARAAEIRK